MLPKVGQPHRDLNMLSYVVYLCVCVFFIYTHISHFRFFFHRRFLCSVLGTGEHKTWFLFKILGIGLFA